MLSMNRINCESWIEQVNQKCFSNFDHDLQVRNVFNYILVHVDACNKAKTDFFLLNSISFLKNR